MASWQRGSGEADLLWSHALQLGQSCICFHDGMSPERMSGDKLLQPPQASQKSQVEWKSEKNSKTGRNDRRQPICNCPIWPPCKDPACTGPASPRWTSNYWRSCKILHNNTNPSNETQVATYLLWP